jgi:protein-disulfide isomerase
MKSVIRNLAVHTTGIEPASLRRRVRIEFGHIGLDVEQGRVVEDIDVEDMEKASFPSHQPDHRHPDRIRPAWGTSREQAMFPFISVRYDPRLVGACAVHPVDQPHPIEAFDVIQCGSEPFIHDDLPLGTLGIDGLNRRTLRLGKRRPNAANHPDVDRVLCASLVQSGYYGHTFTSVKENSIAACPLRDELFAQATQMGRGQYDAHAGASRQTSEGTAGAAARRRLASRLLSEHSDPMSTRLAAVLGSIGAFVLALPVALAVPSSSPTAPTDRPVSLSAKQRQIVDELLTAHRPYECCSDSLAACLKQRPVCPLVPRLERAITRMAAAGLTRPQIEAALAHRQATMMSNQPRAKIALDDRFQAGNAEAAVALVIYACPRSEVCAKLIPDIYREVTSGRLKDKVVFHYRPFFLDGNDEAFECGRGLYAAAYQGKFWSYLLHLCMERGQLQKATLRDWVGSHGLDRCIFDHTCEQPGTAAWLTASREEAVANGVTTAPAAFMNGRRIQGQLDLETLTDMLEEEHERMTHLRALDSSQDEKPRPATKPGHGNRPDDRTRPASRR